jgi:hypothetical protein
MPNPEFEGSRSSTKMHKTSIHDAHKEIRTQTPQNRRNKSGTKIPQNSRKRHVNRSSQEKEIDATMNASIQPEVRFSTKSWRKSILKSRENEKQSRWMSCTGPVLRHLYEGLHGYWFESMSNQGNMCYGFRILHLIPEMGIGLIGNKMTGSQSQQLSLLQNGNSAQRACISFRAHDNFTCSDNIYDIYVQNYSSSCCLICRTTHYSFI